MLIATSVPTPNPLAGAGSEARSLPGGLRSLPLLRGLEKDLYKMKSGGESGRKSMDRYGHPEQCTLYRRWSPWPSRGGRRGLGRSAMDDGIADSGVALAAQGADNVEPRGVCSSAVSLHCRHCRRIRVSLSERAFGA